MTIFQFLNLVLLNVIVWLLLSYFWSYWTYKLFKPYLWLNDLKKKKTTKIIADHEKKFRDKNRFYALWLQLRRIEEQKIPGSMAELGVYKGHTAKLIHHMAPERKLYLFDSFSGLPKQVIREDCDGTIRPQTVKFDNTSKEEVVRYVDGNNNVEVREGIFPETATDLNDEVFAFVHLDADLYQSTIDGLKFFYPRLSPGGCLIVHDYNHDWEGVKKAVDEFSETIPEYFVDMPDMYGSVILVKNRKVKRV
ncbi:MAG: methyltransferase [Chlorobi bacterium]|nr:methyltransferase [Chlorobiota bacterium]